MEAVGIRELKQHTSDILRRVREGKETISITYRGKVVAQIVPVEDKEAMRAKALKVWAEIDELAKEITAHWPAGVSAVEAVKEQRREL
jgi:prevent-host-death family protein